MLLSSNLLTSIEPLHVLTALDTLDASHNHLESLDLRNAAVRTLLVNANRLTTLPSLVDCPRLVTINASANLLTSLAHLALPPSTRMLTLDHNQLADVTGVVGTTHVKELHIVRRRGRRV